MRCCDKRNLLTRCLFNGNIVQMNQEEENGSVKIQIRFQTAEVFIGEVLQAAQILDAAYGAVYAAVGLDGRGAVITHVGMLHQFARAQGVDGETLRGDGVGHHKPGYGIGGKAVYLQQLFGCGISSKTTPVLYDLAGKIGAYAWNTAQRGTVGGVDIQQLVT